MAREFRIEYPADRQAIRDLRVGDTVYLSGLICTLRDMGHRRAVDLLARGEALPFDLSQAGIWHSGPITRLQGGRWHLVSAGPTTSSRFTSLGAELIRRLGIQVIVGKGTMGQEAVDALGEVGGCFLNSTGGCAVLYARQVEEVVAVHWLDLGEPEAAWVVRVKEMGPLLVGIDSTGASLFRQVRGQALPRLAKAYGDAGLAPEYRFAYLPKRVAASGQPAKE